MDDEALLLVEHTVFEALGPGDCVTLDWSAGDELLFGRSARCYLQLDDECAGRLHARLTRRDGVVAVRHLGSTNGTQVNERTIDDSGVSERALADGDLLRMGTTIFRYFERGASEACRVARDHLVEHEWTGGLNATTFAKRLESLSGEDMGVLEFVLSDFDREHQPLGTLSRLDLENQIVRLARKAAPGGRLGNSNLALLNRNSVQPAWVLCSTVLESVSRHEFIDCDGVPAHPVVAVRIASLPSS